VTSIVLTLDAVLVAVTDDEPRLLTVAGDTETPAVPSGPLDPEGDATLERSLRRWIADQAGMDVGYVEQLYTFGDRDRHRRDEGARFLSVAYLALVREAQPAPPAGWRPLYGLFPWEDHREGPPHVIEGQIRPRLLEWAGEAADRLERVDIVFGDPTPWDPVRVLDRYELMYEAGLIAEAFVDHGRAVPAGLPESTAMAFDHRRLAATALGRLRGKLSYRPVVFELMAEMFTLLQLQRTVEALAGVRVHKQNFRRLVERGGLVEGTGERTTGTGGRPAELFRFRREVLRERPRPGMGIRGIGG
jgi:hypothetical protein